MDYRPQLIETKEEPSPNSNVNGNFILQNSMLVKIVFYQILHNYWWELSQTNFLFLLLCNWRNHVSLYQSFIIVHLLWKANSAAAESLGHAPPTISESEMDAYLELKSSAFRKHVYRDSDQEWVGPHQKYNLPTSNIHTTDRFQKVITSQKNPSEVQISECFFFLFIPLSP